MNAFWASENFDAFIASAPLPSREFNAETPLMNDPVFGDQSIDKVPLLR